MCSQQQNGLASKRILVTSQHTTEGSKDCYLTLKVTINLLMNIFVFYPGVIYPGNYHHQQINRTYCLYQKTYIIRGYKIINVIP